MSDVVEAALRSPRLTLGYAPSTFLERGVAVPFTTPALAGARVRPGERDRLELIVGNPSGARGVYILPWEGVYALCAPTLHDRQLNAGVEALRAVTPPAIRQVSLHTAQEGLAGRAAANAAAAARAAETRQVTLTNFELLMLLVRQLRGAGSARERAAADGGDLEASAKRAVAQMAPRLQRSPEAVATMLEELATLLAPIGIGVAAAEARLPAAIGALRRLHEEVVAALRGPPELSNPDADLVAASADLTIACARVTMGDVMALLDDVPALLQRWLAAPDALAARLARPDWLLDGWERICLLWQARRATDEGLFSELADLVPATPREAASWVGMAVEGEAGALRHRRKVQRNEDWRTGATPQDLVARNETLRARALAVAG